MEPSKTERAQIARLRDPRTIRACAEQILGMGAQGKLLHFAVDETRLPAVAERVVRLMRARGGGPAAIPYHGRWRHFGVGGVDRVAMLEERLRAAGASALERRRAHFDLVITSVLLDAGAGPAWTFREPGTGLVCGRSEGLALASYHLFMSGGLSSDPAQPLRAEADTLESLSEATLARAFQVTDANPLVGLPGRVTLLRRLGATMRAGHLADDVAAQAAGGTLTAAAVLAAVLERLSPIWPGRHTIAGENLGDVWPHPRVGLVPFHKLSQWLTYSLLEPLEVTGLRVTDLGALTGLPEYRNGGLFLDAGVVIPRDETLLSRTHAVESDVVVEWRALTVALLDRTAAAVRKIFEVDAETLPLARVLEGGTWSAGREIAKEKRPDGRPPIDVASDGTVF